MYLIQPIDKHGTSYSFSVFSAGAHDLQQAQSTTPRVNGERRRTSTLLHVIKPSSSCRHLFLTLQLQLNQPSHHTKRNTEPHAPKTLASRPRQIYLIHYNTHGTRTRIRVWTCTPCAHTGTVHTYPWPSFSPHPNSLTPVQIQPHIDRPSPNQLAVSPHRHHLLHPPIRCEEKRSIKQRHTIP